MASLEENIAQAISDFDGIKDAIVERGVDVPYGTDTRRYGDLIRNIPSDYDKGFTEGEEAGKKAEYDAFWDAYQNNGNRTDYYAGFRGWKGKCFKPKYDMATTSGYQMFAYFDEGTPVKERLDFVEYLAELGVTLDFSNATTLQYAFWFARIRRLGVVDSRKTTALQQTFNYFIGNTVEKLILKDDGSQTYTQTFVGATNLANLIIEGVIGKNGFNVQSCPLTHDSLISIINALQDKTADTSGTTWKVTLGTDNLAKLTAEELKIMDNKGWTYA